MKRACALFLRLARDSRGYSVIELLTVLVILGVVVGGLTTVFASATRADADMNNRFQAQQAARLALDKIRKEVHCSQSATPTTSTSAVTLAVPGYCKTIRNASVTTSITWCTRSLGTKRYGLYRVVGTTCTGGVKWADYLVPTSTATVCSGALCVFSYTPATATGCVSSCTLARLHVDFPVNVKPTRAASHPYELIDDLVLRNSTRS